jgi:glycosyltransferase involved in cell wall biosynthesis
VTVPSRYLQETLGSYRGDLRLVRNPLDLGSYTYHQRTGPGIRLVWLRAFHAIYNPSLAPRVLARLHADFPELRLTMIGPDKGDGSLQHTIQTARDLGVEGSVDIVGGVPKSEVPAHLGEGDIFLNTTNVDNAPVSVVEAMASGLCVVSTAVGGLPYLLDDGRNALLVPQDDPDSMANAIRRILTEPELASTLSVNARKEAERADWSHVLPQWLEIFQQLAPSRLGARLTA